MTEDLIEITSLLEGEPGGEKTKPKLPFQADAPILEFAPASAKAYKKPPLQPATIQNKIKRGVINPNETAMSVGTPEEAPETYYGQVQKTYAEGVRQNTRDKNRREAERNVGRVYGGGKGTSRTAAGGSVNTTGAGHNSSCSGLGQGGGFGKGKCSISGYGKAYHPNPLIEDVDVMSLIDGEPETKKNLPSDYNQFIEYSKTAPENRRPDSTWEYGNPRQYDHYGMWDALGKPNNFEEALKKNPDWTPNEDDKMYHGFSTNPNTGIWLKPHIPGETEQGSTAWMELKEFALSKDPNWNPNKFSLVFDPEIQRMRYIEKEEVPVESLME